MTRSPLSRIHDLAAMRARAALERVAAAETRLAKANDETQAAKDAQADLAARQSQARAERIDALLAAPTGPVRLARVGLQYAIDVEDLASQDRLIADRAAEAQVRARELEAQRLHARSAANREIKLANALRRIGRMAKLNEESASESDAEDR